MDKPGEGKPFWRRVIPPPEPPTLPKTFDWWGGCAEGARSDVGTGKAPRTEFTPVGNVASKSISKPNLCSPIPQPGGLPPLWPPGASPAPRLQRHGKNFFLQQPFITGKRNTR